jgi:hypothetical protein
MFKAQILAKLVTKYPGLQKTFLGLLADKMAVKVTEESGIDEAITALDNAPISITDLAADFQKEGDRRVTAAEAVWKKKNPPAKPADKTDDDEPTDPPKGDEMPSWAKGLLTEIQTLKSEKQQNTIQSQLKEKLKDVNPLVSWNDWALPNKEEDIAPFIEKVQARHTEIEKTLVDKGLSALGQPKTGSSGGAWDKTKATKEEVSAVLKDIM